MSMFKKAEKRQAKLRLAMTGPSGSGKTWSALAIASGIGKKVALIDTENHSASYYADDFVFDTLEIDSPYTIDKYIGAIRGAVQAGYDVLVIDSISHAWAGEGGLLEKKGALDVRGGNSYTNWAPITKEQEQFKAMLLSCDIHLIVTMRSKQDYVLEINEKGKTSPRKVGLAPIQREGMEYEFSMVLDMGMDHNANVSKTRIKKFDGKLFKPTKETGQELLAWLMEGSPALNPPEPIPPEPEPQKPLEVVHPDHAPEWPHPADMPSIPEGNQTVLVKIEGVHKFKNRTGDGFHYKIMDTGGTLYRTFDAKVATVAKEASEMGYLCSIVYTVDKYPGLKIISMELAQKKEAKAS